MAIFLQFDGITGESTVSGLDGFMEIQTLNWGTSRPVAGAHSAARGTSEATVQNVVLTRQWDSVTPMLVDAVWRGGFDNTATIRFVQTGSGTPTTYGEFKLEKCGIAGYSVIASGAQPVETLTLNFTKLTVKSFKVDDDMKTIPSTASYDTEAAR